MTVDELQAQMNAAPAKGEWLDFDDFELEFGVPKPTQYTWRHKGIGPKSVRLGRRVKYRRTDIEEWIREQERLESVRRER